MCVRLVGRRGLDDELDVSESAELELLSMRRGGCRRTGESSRREWLARTLDGETELGPPGLLVAPVMVGPVRNG